MEIWAAFHEEFQDNSFITKAINGKGESKKWQKGLDEQATKDKTQRTLRIEIDDEAFDRLYGYESHPIPKVKGKKIAVRVVSQFGEESTLVRGV